MLLEAKTEEAALGSQNDGFLKLPATKEVSMGK